MMRIVVPVMLMLIKTVPVPKGIPRVLHILNIPGYSRRRSSRVRVRACEENSNNRSRETHRRRAMMRSQTCQNVPFSPFLSGNIPSFLLLSQF